MFWNKKDKMRPCGVPLDEVLKLLEQTTLSPSIQGNSLVATHEHYSTRVEVLPPKRKDSENGPIRAIVKITTGLPDEIQAITNGPEAANPLNAFAGLGALTSESGKSYVGSRLTIYDAESAWPSLQLPFVAFTAIQGAEAILGGLRRSFGVGSEAGPDSTSAWTEGDLAQVEGFLSGRCVCTTGGLGLTAEFALDDGAAGSALAGDHHTALFQLMADQPHPEVGGGLFCLLQMPHQLRDASQLREACNTLNCMEMAAEDAPPHFGAWCEGKLGNNPAYVSFLPNVLHGISGVALNSTMWSVSRARWAAAALASMGLGA